MKNHQNSTILQQKIFQVPTLPCMMQQVKTSYTP